MSDSGPQLTVVYPAVDVRGSAAERLRTWTHGQTLARHHYRVAVGCAGSTPSEERQLTDLLSPRDELFRIPNAGAMERRRGTSRHAMDSLH